MELEFRFAIAEDAEDICRQACIAMASGSNKDVEADTGWRVQVRRFDAFLPGVKCSFILRHISNYRIITYGVEDMHGKPDWHYPKRRTTDFQKSPSLLQQYNA